MAGLAGGYGNIGYMGPGLALATFGPQAAVPVALIFCFDSVFLFSIVPLLMALFQTERRPLLPMIAHVAKQIVFHPLIVASWLGALAAAFHFDPPVAVDRTLQFLQSAAAPVALFALGVTVALRPFDRVPWEVPGVVAVKLLVQPLIAFAMLSLLGPFDREWIATALLMASLPPALNAFIIARQYDTWVEASSTAVLVGTHGVGADADDHHVAVGDRSAADLPVMMITVHVKRARRDRLAHDEAAQRADLVQRLHAEAARELHRQQIRQQRAVGEIDHEASG